MRRRDAGWGDNAVIKDNHAVGVLCRSQIVSSHKNVDAGLGNRTHLLAYILSGCRVQTSGRFIGQEQPWGPG